MLSKCDFFESDETGLIFPERLQVLTEQGLTLAQLRSPRQTQSKVPRPWPWPRTPAGFRKLRGAGSRSYTSVSQAHRAVSRQDRPEQGSRKPSPPRLRGGLELSRLLPLKPDTSCNLDTVK